MQLYFLSSWCHEYKSKAAKLWYVTRDAWYVFNGLSGHFAKNPNYTKCSTSSTIRSYFDDAIDVVSIGTDQYIFGKDGPTGKLYKMKLNSSGCPTGTIMYVNQVDTECGQEKEIAFIIAMVLFIQLVTTGIKFANIETMEIQLQQ